MSSDDTLLDLMAIQIDGLHIHDEDGMLMLKAVGVETGALMHTPCVVEGTT